MGFGSFVNLRLILLFLEMFIPMLIILKLFKLKLLLFLPFILGITGLKKILGLAAIVLPGLLLPLWIKFPKKTKPHINISIQESSGILSCANLIPDTTITFTRKDHRTSHNTPLRDSAEPATLNTRTQITRVIPTDKTPALRRLTTTIIGTPTQLTMAMVECDSGMTLKI